MKKRILTRAMSYMMAFLVAVSSIQLPVYAEEIVVQEENTVFEVEEEDVNDAAIGDKSKLEEDEAVEEVELDLFNQPEFYELEEELELLNLPELYGPADAAEVTKEGAESEYFEYLTIGGVRIDDCTKYMEGTGWQVEDDVVYLDKYNGSGIQAKMKSSSMSMQIILVNTSVINDNFYGIKVTNGGLALGAFNSIPKLTINTGYMGISCVSLTISSGSYFINGNGSNLYAAIGKSSDGAFEFDSRASLTINWNATSDSDVYGLRGILAVSGSSLGKMSIAVVNNGAGSAYAHDMHSSVVEKIKKSNTVYSSDEQHFSINKMPETHTLTVKDGTVKISDKNTTVADIETYKRIEIEADNIPGKIFKEWEVVSGGYFPIESYYTNKTFITMPITDVTMKAVYEDVLVTLSYDANGGTGTMSPVTLTYDQSYRLPSTCEFIAPVDKEFGNEWIISSSSGSMTKPAGSIISPTEDLIIKPVWVKEKVTISFEANGGTGVLSPITVEKGSNYILPKTCGFTAPTGKRFGNKWIMTMEGASVTLPAGYPLNAVASLTLQPVWVDEYYDFDIETGILTIHETMPEMEYDEFPWYEDKALIKEVIVEEGVTVVPSNAFADCKNLTKVTLPSTLTSFSDAFKGSGITSITIPEGITEIPAWAFYRCNGLTEIRLPDTIQKIGSMALYVDKPALVTVIYNGTEADWAKITVDGSNNIPKQGTIIYMHDHIGGTATCTQKAICTICGGEYGERRNHDFSEQGNAEKCELCGAKNINYTGLDSSVVIGDKIYTGSAITSDVTILGLTKGVDYTVDNVTETEKGTYTVKITGIGDYAGERIVYWKIVAGGLYIAAIPDQTYTGNVIKPVLDVYCDGVLLTAGKDYTITYGKYNTNVAAKDAMSKGKSVAPSVTITGKGNYSDKKVMTFEIVPCSVDTATVNDMLVAKTGKAIKITPTVKVKGKTLKLGTDYVVSTSTSLADAVTSYKDSGEYNLWVVGKNNYSGAVPFKFTIAEKTLASKVTIGKISDQKYDGGNQVRPAVKVTYNKKDIASDFDITYKDNTEIGTATVTITAKSGSEFVGTKTATFKITGVKISGAKLGADGKGTIPSRVYDGTAYKPALDLYVGSTPLTYGTDYEVTYTNNVKVGTATATVVGKGQYTGSKKFTFKITGYNATTDASSRITINGANADVVDISVAYEKGGVIPKPVVKFGSTVLKEKTDYTLSYANNKAVADKTASKAPTMTITFKGNLTGKKTVKFAITNKNIAEGKITIADKAYSTKANAWKQTAVTIVDTNGKKLVAGTDYEKTFKYYSDAGCTSEITDSTLPADTRVYVKVDGIKNYAGTYIVGSYRISKNNLSKVSASIASQTYTGKAICPDAGDIKVWVGSGLKKTDLVPGVDYEVVPSSYTNNINKGTATVTIVGKGNYYGTKVVKFTIGTKKFLWWEL